MQYYIGTKLIEAEPEARDSEEGYKVRYPDGYESWSPAAAFEAAYKPTTQLDFAGALLVLKNGGTVTREGWNGRDMWLKVQTPDGGSKMTLPYIYMCTADGDFVPWLASQTDLLADDWIAETLA